MCWTEVQVMSHQGKLFRLGQEYDSSKLALSLLDEEGNPRLQIYVPFDPQDLMQERVDAEIFGEDLYLSGFVTEENFKLDRRYGVLKIPGVGENIAGAYNGRPRRTMAKRIPSSEPLLFPDRELHSFKKVKYKDLAYLAGDKNE